MNKIDMNLIEGKINSFLAKYPVIDGHLNELSSIVKVKKALIAIGAFSVLALLLFIAGGPSFIIDLVGFVYPVYASFKSIESENVDDDKQWLTYWLVFSLFKIFEGVADALVSFIPFYFIGKVLFLIYCYYPSTKGATVIYTSLIRPYVIPALGLTTAQPTSTPTSTATSSYTEPKKVD
jgi:receptor expression-enhancing protein 5/6